MADAAGRDRWNHTATLLALISNCHRDPKKSPPVRPRDFHPYAGSVRRAGALKPRIGIDVLKQVFIDRRPMHAR
jgi:hypothetical protein